MKQRREIQPAAVFCVLAAVVVLSSFCVPGEYFAADHDGAFYALAARSILRGTYTLGISPGEPALTFLTPGWPLLLAPAAALSQDNPIGYQLWSWLWLAACIPLAYLWMKPRMGRGAALLGAAAFGLNPFVLSRAGVVGSEPAALALTLGLLLRLEGADPVSARTAGLWLGFLYWVRPAALILWPAVWLDFFFRRRRDFFSCVLWSFPLPWLWLAWSHFGGGVSEADELAMTLSGQGLAGYLRTAFLNAQAAGGLLGRSLMPWPIAADAPLAWVSGILLFIAAGAGLVDDIRKRRSLEPAAVYLAAGTGLHAVWAWWFERYLLVFFPFLIWAAWAGLRRYLSRNAAAAALALALVLPLPAQSLRLARSRAERIVPAHAQAYRWIRENTPEQALFASAFYARDAFYCARPFLPLPTGDGPLAERMRSRRIYGVFWEAAPSLGSTLGEGFYWSRILRGFQAELAAAPLIVLTLPGGSARLYTLPD